MDATTRFIVSGMAGTPVDLVIYDGGQISLVKTEVETPLPLCLKVVGKSTSGIRPARRVMMLAHHEGLAMRADGHLNGIEKDDEGLHLEISQVHWELLERRRHVRVPISISATIRAVAESQSKKVAEQITGDTIDLSISGAFVRVSSLPEEGTLVEFVADLDGEKARALAVVAHITRARNGVGLHFVEYLDNARHILNTFLTKAA